MAIASKKFVLLAMLLVFVFDVRGEDAVKLRVYGGVEVVTEVRGKREEITCGDTRCWKNVRPKVNGSERFMKAI